MKTFRRGPQYSQILFWFFISLSLLWGISQVIAEPTGVAPVERSAVVINEVGIVPLPELLDEDGDAEPWIEIHNRGSRPVQLLDWTLTDSPDEPDQWRFPDVTLGAGEYLLLFASGKDRYQLGNEETSGFLHTNFRLNEESRFLALYAPTARRFLDTVPLEWTTHMSGLTLGRYAERGTLGMSNVAYGYFDTPTPGTPNSAEPAWRGHVEPVTFGQKGGVFSRPLRVELRTETADARIRYTLDGSTPSETSGHEYVEPLPIDSTTILRAGAFLPGHLNAPVSTQTYIFPESVVQQPEAPPGWPQTWGTHRIDFGGYSAGEAVVADYAMDPEITESSEYGSAVIDGLLALPSVSIVTDPANLDIYFVDPQGRGREWERPASIEFLYPDDPDRNFQVDAGIRIQGGAGRWEFMPKHSFRLFFRSDYGPTKLRQPIFDDSPVQEFETLVLRGGVDRSFVGHPPAPDAPRDHRDTTYLRDEWARASQIALSGVGSHGSFVHLYLNGLYWGLYNLVERPDAAFMTSYYGGDESDWFTASHGGAGDGLIDRFRVLQELAAAGGLADRERYATMLEFIDPIQFSDYILLNWFAGNRDWPENNWYANVRYPAGRNLFFVWDAEDTWNAGAEIHLGGAGLEGAPFPNVIGQLFTALMENPDFRLLFADRVYRHLYHDGALSEANAQARWQTLADALAPAIVAESARWGDGRYEDPITPADWDDANERVLEQMVGNGERLLAQMRERGFYPLPAPPGLSQFGGEFTEQLELSMESVGGTIYYTLDGSDPRAAGTGQPSPSAHVYTEPLVLRDATKVRARTRDESGAWSALADAHFWRVGQVSDLRITEIMYHPPDGEAYEFIELQNQGALDADLSGAYFEGIDFRFPDHTVLPAGGIVTLVADFKTFRSRYATAEIWGIYSGHLANNGETISLYDRSGSVLASVTYDDANGWPLSADGAGDSIVWRGRGSPDSPQNWRASRNLHGSPGESE